MLKGKDIQMLSDLILAATNDGIKKVKELIKERVRNFTGGLNLSGEISQFFGL